MPDYSKFRLSEEQVAMIKLKGNVSAQARAVGLTPCEIYNALAGRKRLTIEQIAALLALPDQVVSDPGHQRTHDIHSARARVSRLKMEVADRQKQINKLQEGIDLVEKLMGLHKP